MLLYLQGLILIKIKKNLKLIKSIINNLKF